MKASPSSPRAQAAQPSLGRLARLAILLGASASIGCRLFSSRYAPAGPGSREEQLAAFLADRFETWLDLHPMEATLSGLRRGLVGWDEVGAAARQRERELALADAERLQSEFPVRALDPAAARDREHFSRLSSAQRLSEPARDWLVVLTLGQDCVAAIPRVLMRQQETRDPTELDAYLTRMARAAEQVDDYRAELLAAAERGRLPMRATIEDALALGGWLTSGAPFQGPAPSPLLADLEARIATLHAQAARAAGWRERGLGILEDALGPAYARLMATLERLLEDSNDLGLWSREGGAECYAFLSAARPGLATRPEAVHERSLRESEELYHSLTRLAREQGRAAEGASDEEVLEALRSERWRLSEVEPEAPEPPAPEVGGARSEPDRLQQTRLRLRSLLESAPPLAAWLSPAAPPEFRFEAATPLQSPRASTLQLVRPAGERARPARIALDVGTLASLPGWRLEACLAADIFPGRLYLDSLLRGLERQPAYRRAAPPGAFVDGWSHYAVSLLAEALPETRDELAFAAMADELWSSALATADGGIHVGRWTRERALDYLRATTPWTERELKRGLDSILLEPGRAVAARAGLLAIRGLRREAESALGARLSLPAFHSALWAEGDLPLDLLSESVREWILRELP